MEINYSLIQAARKGRSFRMPEDFIRYVSGFPKAKSKVQTGTTSRGDPIKKDLNAEDKVRKTVRHKFLPLGDSWYVVKALWCNPNEGFDRVLNECGVALTSDYMQKWKTVHDLRNPPSHTEVLTYRDYEQILITLLPDMFTPLVKIKQVLRPK